MIRRVILPLVVVILCLPVPAAQARVARDVWQVSLQMPPQLWDDGGYLHNVTPRPDVFKVGRTTYRITWTNAAILQMPRFMLKQQGAPYGHVTAGLYDRPLTKAQLRTFKLRQRVLWTDADVLLAPRESLACGGITGDQLQKVVTGQVTDWRTIFEAWPEEQSSAIRLVVARDAMGKPRWAFGRNAFRGARLTTDAGTKMLAANELGIQKYSAVRARLSTLPVCVVPVNGVAASDHTVRSLRFPRSYRVFYVSRANPSQGFHAKPAVQIRRWERHLFGAPGDRYLTTSLGRSRLIP